MNRSDPVSGLGSGSLIRSSSMGVDGSEQDSLRSPEPQKYRKCLLSIVRFTSFPKSFIFSICLIIFLLS